MRVNRSISLLRHSLSGESVVILGITGRWRDCISVALTRSCHGRGSVRLLLLELLLLARGRAIASHLLVIIVVLSLSILLLEVLLVVVGSVLLGLVRSLTLLSLPSIPRAITRLVALLLAGVAFTTALVSIAALVLFVVCRIAGTIVALAK